MTYTMYNYFTKWLKARRLLKLARDTLFKRNAKWTEFKVRSELDVKAIIAMDVSQL